MNASKRRRLFQLSWLVVLAPVYFFVQQLNPAAPEANQERLLLDGEVGLWDVELTEESSLPHGSGSGGWVKEYRLDLKEKNREALKAVFISLGSPGQAKDSVVLSGGPASYHGELELSAASEGEEIWLTMEEWSGRLRVVRLP